MRYVTIPLMWRFFIFYFCIMLFGVSILTLSNVYILNTGLMPLLDYNLLVLMLEGLIGVLFLQLVTLAGLRNTRKLLKSKKRLEEEYYPAWCELVNFPSRIFMGMAGFGVFASVFYHLGEYSFYKDPITAGYIIELASIVLFEQTLSLILALLFFTGARRLLRPHVLQIPVVHINKLRKTTFYYNTLTIFCCLLIIMIYSILWYVFDCILNARTLRISFLVYLTLFDFCFGFVIFRFYIREIKEDFGVLIEAMSSLLKGSRAQLKKKVPIVSNDEIGELGLIFNKLQEKVSKEYDEIEAELELASSIQQRLLPEGEKVYGPYTVLGTCKPCHDVGGDFFDIILQDSCHFAVLIGDVVGKGMPAALIMSAMLLLFRNEMLRGSTAPEALDRMNEMVIGLGLNDVCITLGIAVFDINGGIMKYASAGHVAPYIVGKKGVRQLMCSSLPIGICMEEAYDQVEYEIEEGDRFIFYTDGIVDAFGSNEMSGFDHFENLLGNIENDLSAVEQLDYILEAVDSRETDFEDDKTLLIVHYK